LNPIFQTPRWNYYYSIEKCLFEGGEILQGRCSSLEWLAAYVDDKLTPAEKTIIEHHLAKCIHCRRVIEIMIKSESEVPSPLPPNWSRAN
jgi:Putative zinc-finger